MRKFILSFVAIILATTMIYSNLPDTIKASEYLNEAVLFQKKFKPKQALPLLKKALVIFLESDGEHSEKVSDVYYSLGNCYLDLAEYDKALENLQKSLKIRLDILDASSIKIADSYTLIGLYYDYLAKYDDALELYEKALRIYKNKLPQDDPRIGIIYNNIGICIYFKGDVQRAYLYFEKTFSITIDQFGNDDYKVSQDLNNIGICYSEMKKYFAALEKFQNAIKIATTTEKLKTTLGAQLFHSSGVNFFQLKQYVKALEYLNKALEIRLKEAGPNHPEVATNYYAIGLCYLNMKKFDIAKDYFKRALKINIMKFGKYHPETGMCYERIAKVHLEQAKLTKALENIDLALSSFQYNEQSVLKIERLPNIQLIEVLDSKAKIHKNKFETTGNQNDLSISNQTYNILIKLINKFRVSYKEERSKEMLADKYYHIYDNAIEVSYMLFENTNDSTYLHESFRRSENSSSLVLLQALRNSRAKLFAGIPDSLLKKERELKLDITYSEQQKYEEEERGKDEKDDFKILKINSKIFDLKQKYYDLIRLFETKYPQYYRLKYDLKTISVAEIQKNILDPDQAIVEYFLGEKSVFVFIITKTSFSVKKIAKDFPLEEWISQLRANIIRFQFPFNLPDNYHSELVNTSHLLYEQLIKPVEKELPKRIIIIPGDALAYIPFEVFITKINGKAYEYKKHDYLLKDYSIGYCYSATLLQEMIEKRRSIAEESLVVVAPIFGSNTKPVTLRSMNFASLKYNIPEAKKVANLIGGKTLLAEKATEKVFTEEAYKYHLIHLATHGKANDEVGEYCHLGFTEILDTIENEWLFVKDVYNIELNAAMITLSACETGVGEIRKGEGVISLARSFSYAGAGCINSTLWKVSDAKTADLMASFYENIRSGDSKDEAMRQAKLSFINTFDNMEVHPFYWSSFIAIGDMISIEPKRFSHSYPWFWMIFGLGFIILLCGFFYYNNASFRNFLSFSRS